jgi:hypothetical protein
MRFVYDHMLSYLKARVARTTLTFVTPPRDSMGP